MKSELFWRLNVASMTDQRMREALSAYAFWYNSERPHQSLRGATPEERLLGRKPKIEGPKYEVRKGFPSRASPGHQIPLRAATKLELIVTNEHDFEELPTVRLRKAA